MSGKWASVAALTVFVAFVAGLALGYFEGYKLGVWNQIGLVEADKLILQATREYLENGPHAAGKLCDEMIVRTPTKWGELVTHCVVIVEISDGKPIVKNGENTIFPVGIVMRIKDAEQHMGPGDKITQLRITARVLNKNSGDMTVKEITSKSVDL